MSTQAAFVDLSTLERLTDRLPAEFLEHHGLLPLELAPAYLRVGTWRDPPDPQALDDLALLFERPVVLENLPESEVRAAIRRLYGGIPATAEAVIAALPDVLAAGEEHVALDDLVSLANQAPVVKLVNLLLLEALEARASDVHLEGYAERVRVRYRIDGVLQDAPSPPAHLKAAVVSRLKIMADLDIAERRLPQDGRIRLRLQDRQVDVRVSTLPALHGESIVLRMLDKDRGRIGLDDLGMGEETLSGFRRAISRPNGIVLATGPTGSGKTTTLYAAVEHVRTGREKILTVEDPVEYELDGVPQIAVNEKVGLTFAAALRALLRQDPDVLLVGEIRDEETADIATHAALTGHLVLSTLHTNDAPTALPRLIDLGVPAYLVASTVEAVLAQRLVRVLCPRCREEAEPPPRWSDAFAADDAGERAVFRARGCSECRGTGYRGRIGLYELLLMTDEIRAAIAGGISTPDLRRLAVAQGMPTLRRDGLRHILAGTTSVEEVLRVTTA